MRSPTEIDAAAAHSAIVMPEIGIVLLSRGPSGSSGLELRTWITMSSAISARPPNSGSAVTGDQKWWEVSSEAPKNAAIDPTAARPMASGSLGAERSAGGVWS